MTEHEQTAITILLVAEGAKIQLLRDHLAVLLPRSKATGVDLPDVAHGQGALPVVDAAVVDGDTRAMVDAARVLRARGFTGPLVVVVDVPDEEKIRGSLDSLGATYLRRPTMVSSPAELAKALATAFSANAAVTDELRRARRVLAAGIVALSLQHAINNPLAALMAEAQLLQMEELRGDQRDSVDRIVELCRRIGALMKQLDALAES